MKKLPRTFCVTLHETPARTKEFLEGANQAGVDVELFYGVFGRRMGLHANLSNELECPGKNIHMTDGAIGCYLSHFMLWNLLQYLPEEEFLVMEDDAVFEQDFLSRFQETYARLPSDWDIVYVGWVPFGGDEHIVPVEQGIGIGHPNATHAYLIKKSLLKTAINVIQPCRSPLDLTIGKYLLPLTKYYLFVPPLVTQRSYLNTDNTIWSSLVYDWKNDLYGHRRKMFRDTSLGFGWYNLETNEKDMWKWSDRSFAIYVPNTLDSIHLEVSTPKPNIVRFKGSEEIESHLSIGDNEVRIPCKGLKLIEGVVEYPFVPKDDNPTSTDSRTLGICLKKITLVAGLNEINVPLDCL